LKQNYFNSIQIQMGTKSRLWEYSNSHIPYFK